MNNSLIVGLVFFLPDGDEEAEYEHGDTSRQALSWVVRYLV